MGKDRLALRYIDRQLISLKLKNQFFWKEKQVQFKSIERVFHGIFVLEMINDPETFYESTIEKKNKFYTKYGGIFGYAQAHNQNRFLLVIRNRQPTTLENERRKK